MTSSITITIHDEVSCTVSGLKQLHLQHFCAEYALHAENYFFNPKFKLGSWDGKIRYFHADGKTFVNLLPEIIPQLLQLGYTVDEAIDHRDGKFYNAKVINKDIFSDFKFDDSDAPISLYEHQVRVVNDLLKDGGGTAIAATGAGKTLMCAAIAKQYNAEDANTIVIVPSADLVLQTREDIASVGLDCGEYSGDRKDFDRPVVVSTWQALKNNPTILKEFQIVIVDECHGLKGNVLQKLLGEHGAHIVHRFGVTGTLPKGKTDAMAVLISVGEVKCEIKARELMDTGILADLHIHIEQLEEDFMDKYNNFISNNPSIAKPPTYKQFKDGYFPDYTAEKSFTQTNGERINYLAQRIDILRKEGNTFILIDGIAFGKKLSAAIDGAYFVHGKDKKKARKEIYDLFKENDNLVVIANVQIASTGLNIKRIYNLGLIDIGKSFTRVIQSIGRGLRVADDKTKVDVYDFCSDLKYGKKHLATRKKYYKEAEYPHNKQVIPYTKEEIIL